MLTLRPYQQAAIEALREKIAAGKRRLILCAPTGAGKTAMFSFIVASHLQRGGTALVITDRTELLMQAGGAFGRLSLQPSVIAPSKRIDLDMPLHCGMVETIHRRCNSRSPQRRGEYRDFLASRSLVICDEAHKVAFDKLIPLLHPSAIVIGATATPLRKGAQPSLDTLYSDIVTAADTPDLIAQGFLSRAITYGVDIDLSGIKKKSGEWDSDQVAQRYAENKTYEGVVENYSRICPGEKTLLFASNIASCKDICQRLQSAGYQARSVDHTMPQAERRAILTWFAATRSGILCNVGILTAGYDCPDLRCIILYRATTSLILFLQMVGRGSRIAEGKDSFTILDFGNNVKTHGFWQQPRQWSLAKEKKRDKQGVPLIRQCDKCGALIPAQARKCEYCGHERPMTEAEKKEREYAELKLLDYGQIKRGVKAGQYSLSELEAIRKARGYKVGWLIRQLTDPGQLEEYRKMKGYKKGWLRYQQLAMDKEASIRRGEYAGE